MQIRKLKTKKDEAKKQKKNQLTLGIILILVMVGGTFGIVVNSFGKEENLIENKLIYNGQEFLLTNNLWYTELGQFQFALKTSPNESIYVEENLRKISYYSNAPLYIYSENYESKTEIYRNFYYVAERMQDACVDSKNMSTNIGDLDCDENWPEKNCENNIIIIKENDEDKIIQEENCLIILGKKENLTKLTDSVILKIIGLQ